MKKILIISLLCLTTALSGCVKKQIETELKGDQKTENLSNLPMWVLDPEVSDGVGAVGIAAKSRGGIKFQMKQAMVDGKANIAAAVQSEISRITKNALREAKVNDINDVEEVFSEATKEVVKNMPLSGVKRRNIHQAEDGTLYVHVVLVNEDYSGYIKNSQKMYEQRLKDANIGRDNLDKSQEAVKGLFEELEKERER